MDGISGHVALSKGTVRMMADLGESAFYRTFEPVYTVSKFSRVRLPPATASFLGIATIAR